MSFGDLNSIVSLARKFLNDTNPKIRYAACHLIAQLANDCRREFEWRYHKELIPLLLGNLSDNASRVVSQRLAALGIILEEMKQGASKQYLEAILNSVLPLAQEGIPIVRQEAIDVISALAIANLFSLTSRNAFR